MRTPKSEQGTIYVECENKAFWANGVVKYLYRYLERSVIASIGALAFGDPISAPYAFMIPLNDIHGVGRLNANGFCPDMRQICVRCERFSHKILTSIVNDNVWTIETFTDQTFTISVPEKMRAYHWKPSCGSKVGCFIHDMKFGLCIILKIIYINRLIIFLIISKC